MAPHRRVRSPGGLSLSRLTLASLAVCLCLLIAAAMSSWMYPATLMALSYVRPAAVSAADVDVGWHAPARTDINNLTKVLDGEGVYGFIYDTSDTPDDDYGAYNWCNMPHVRRTEYVKPSDEFELQYVELVREDVLSLGWSLC